MDFQLEQRLTFRPLVDVARECLTRTVGGDHDHVSLSECMRKLKGPYGFPSFAECPFSEALQLIELELELIQSHMAQKPMLIAQEAGVSFYEAADAAEETGLYGTIDDSNDAPVDDEGSAVSTVAWLRDLNSGGPLILESLAVANDERERHHGGKRPYFTLGPRTSSARLRMARAGVPRACATRDVVSRARPARAHVPRARASRACTSRARAAYVPRAHAARAYVSRVRPARARVSVLAPLALCAVFVFVSCYGCCTAVARIS